MAFKIIRPGLSGWDHTMEGGLGLGDANPPAVQNPAAYPTGFPGHVDPWTPSEITALGENWHYDLVTGLLTNAFPVDPVSMGMAWDSDSGAYQTLDYFNKYALPAPAAVAQLPMCGPHLAAGVMCDPGYGDVAIPNPPYPGGSVQGAGPIPPGHQVGGIIYGTLPPETSGVQVPLLTIPVIPEQTPFDPYGSPVPTDVTLPTDQYVIPLGAGNTLAAANGGNVSPAPIAPLAPAQAAGVSGFGGTAMLALLGIAGAVWVMSKEQRR
jgi:hypothetical protein